MTSFFLPLLGGVMIGLSAVILLVALGRIAGISGIIWSAITDMNDSVWRWLFLFGLIAGAWIFHAISGRPMPIPELSLGYAAAAGLLVGVGVKLGSGCTSGHGVCGIGRLSGRSFVATCTFMACGIVTVYVMRHV